MPSKKRKYNARFPAGRIKKIMQTDEEVGKVAQAVPIIISFRPTPRTLELFVESLLSKAMQVTMSRNAKTLSPSHVKQCILAESRFDFLRDLVKNIPDVSAAEEKEMMSAENSPNSSRFSEMPVAPRRLAREDSNSSNSSDLRVQHKMPVTRESLRRVQSCEGDLRPPRTETVTSTIVSGEEAIDLSKKTTDFDVKRVRSANFYQETLNLNEEVQHKTVIKLNPTYTTPQPSTSSYAIFNSVELQRELQRVPIPLPKTPDVRPLFSPGLRPLNNNVAMPKTPLTPLTPVAPILNIDFSKSLVMPEIKVLDSTVANAVGVNTDVKPHIKIPVPVQRQYKTHKSVESRKVETRPSVSTPALVNVDNLNSGNLQIDEDYDT